MIKRIIIICEGQTEQGFCNKILAPHLADKNIIVQASVIKKSAGGIVKWGALKKQIVEHLKYETTVFVTTLVDYYGLAKMNFPEWETAQNIVDRNKRIDILEQAMATDIADTLRFRFIPYIQLHEFEGLLFNTLEVFDQVIPEKLLIGKSELHKTFSQYDNPEMINDQATTIPSQRLKRIVDGYNKILHGTVLANEIGLARIRQKSPRFNEWVKKTKIFNAFLKAK